MSRPRTIQNPRRFLVTVEKDTHQDLIRLTALRSLDEQRTITLSEYVRDLLERETGNGSTKKPYDMVSAASITAKEMHPVTDRQPIQGNNDE